MIQKTSYQDILLIKKIEFQNLIHNLTRLLNIKDVEKNKKKPNTLVKEDLEPKNQFSDKEDLIMILGTKMDTVNTTNYEYLYLQRSLTMKTQRYTLELCKALTLPIE